MILLVSRPSRPSDLTHAYLLDLPIYYHTVDLSTAEFHGFGLIWAVSSYEHGTFQALRLQMSWLLKWVLDARSEFSRQVMAVFLRWLWIRASDLMPFRRFWWDVKDRVFHDREALCFSLCVSWRHLLSLPFTLPRSLHDFSAFDSFRPLKSFHLEMLLYFTPLCFLFSFNCLSEFPQEFLLHCFWFRYGQLQSHFGHSGFARKA